MKEYAAIIYPIELCEYLCYPGVSHEGIITNRSKWDNIHIEELELAPRAYNSLFLYGNIRTIGDLIRRTETELFGLRNFGITSLRDVKRKLNDLGLRLGQFE